MHSTIDLHPTQMEILRELLFMPAARFRDLNAQRLSTDKFTFHVKRLIEAGLVVKVGDLYELTVAGKEFANRLDTDTAKIEKQAKIGIAVTCVREGARGTEYLIHERLKQPFYGYFGFATGKVRFGETVLETAARELMEETGLSADLSIVLVKHKMDYDAEGTLLEDKFFFTVRGDNPTGTLEEEVKEGKNHWMTRAEIKKLNKAFDNLEETLDLIDSKTITFSESKYTVSGF